MSIYKRGSIYWTRFTCRGERYQKSLDTTNRLEAIVRERKTIVEAEKGFLAADVTDFARLTFGDALHVYLKDRQTCISSKTKKPLAPKTKKTEAERAIPLPSRLGGMPVKKFTADLIYSYIRERLETVQNGTINRELDLIRGVLRRANVWARLADRVKALPPGESIGRAFSDEEKLRIEKTAATNPEWMNARLAYVLAINTSMRPCEIKSLCWSDVDWQQRIITIRESKTDKGKRSIPLNDAALEAMRELQAVSKSLHGDFLMAGWYVFPGKKPSVPITSWRTAWKSMLRAAGMPHTRFYDTRHTAVTDLLQNPAASEETVRSIVGHVSQKMLERYSHARIEAKRRAVESLPQRSATKLLQSGRASTLADR